MKRLVLIGIIFGSGMSLTAQETIEKVMEKRAREMHRVIGLTDEEQWKIFMKENYTQALIDKPMKMTVDISDGGSDSNQAKTIDNLDAKVVMYERLHDDFGKSKIVSIKPSGENLKMILKNEDGLSGVFSLAFSKDKPYLIAGLGIEVQDNDQ